MNFPEAVKSGFAQAKDFQGTATRSEFWWFYVFNVVCSWLAGSLDVLLGLNWSRKFDSGFTISGGGLSAAVSILLLLPMVAVFYRRIHAVGKRATPLVLFMLVLPLAMVAAALFPDGQSHLGMWRNVLIAVCLIEAVLLVYVLVLLCRKGLLEAENVGADLP